MTFKQWSAVIMLLGIAVIAIWLVADIFWTYPTSGGAAAVAARLLWAGLAMIVFNIVAAIISAIVGSIVTRTEFKDVRADERDKAVYAKSMRNAYFTVSMGGLAALFAFALGYDPAVAAYAVFTGGLVAGGVGAASQLYYYRIG